MAEPRHHYYPAALIAQFRVADTTKTGRRAPLWVGRRGVNKPLLLAADDCGWDPDNRRLYDTEDGDDRLDTLWQRSERQLGLVRSGFELLQDDGPAPAGWFINHVAPFVAQLLARPPRLVLDDLSDLTADSVNRDDAVNDRGGVFAQFLDALVYTREWLLVRCDQPSFITSDLGWQWMPGPRGGDIFVPLSPNMAVILRQDGRPTYFHGDDLIGIPVVSWPRAQLDLLAETMMLSAPREVYCSTKEQAEHALDLWGENGTARPPDNDMAPALAHWESWVLGWAGLLGASQDPIVAWHRFLVASHRFAGCECEDVMRRQGLNRQQRRRALAVQRRNLAAAERHLQVRPQPAL